MILRGRACGLGARVLSGDRAALCLGLVAIAFLTAPRACSGGLDIYFRTGIGGLVALAVLPWLLRAGRTRLVQCVLSLVLLVLGGLAWIAGLFAADFRIICALF